MIWNQSVHTLDKNHKAAGSLRSKTIENEAALPQLSSSASLAPIVGMSLYKGQPNSCLKLIQSVQCWHAAAPTTIFQSASLHSSPLSDIVVCNKQELLPKHSTQSSVEYITDFSSVFSSASTTSVILRCSFYKSYGLLVESQRGHNNRSRITHRDAASRIVRLCPISS